MTRAKTAYMILSLFLVYLLMSLAAHAQDVPRISKEKLKEELQSPDIIVLDVRTDRDWETNQWKIAGAVREDPSKVGDWKGKYSRDKTIVLYCA
jgi:rhodanese-related sulfurtransferase